MAALRRILVTLVVCACTNGPARSAQWNVVAQGQPAALLSVWAGSASNVWVVGGHPGNATNPIVEHYDGATWTKLDTTSLANLDLWWVRGFPDGVVMVSGGQGTIAVSTDGQTFAKQATPPGNAIVFGVWGAASNDAWAVGGTGASGGFVWHYDGTTWTARTDLPTDISTAGTCWKVNGTASNDVWMSCTNGWVLHWNGSTLDSMAIPQSQQQQDSLFSISASSTRVVTVGGSQSGVLYENTGGGWNAPLGDVGILLSGVAVTDTDAYAVGGAGTVLHSTTIGKWSSDSMVTTQSLHAPFIDSSGGVWAVGGDFNATPTTSGVLLHKGAPLAGSFP